VTPCEKCRAERDRYRKEAAELRMARLNDAAAAKKRESELYVRLDDKDDRIRELEKRVQELVRDEASECARANRLAVEVQELESQLAKARALLAEAGPVLAEGAKMLRDIAERGRG
jgi:chromosome segregation ATPase